nr:hypothetical protein [Tanacetum cinerariifolium]
MDQQNPTLSLIPILDTGKFKQWQFRIQQYLQHEHYGLWEVIEFGDSYEAPGNVATTGTTSDGIGKKKGMTVTLTVDDMQKRKNDVKARTTLLLSLPDEHQLQFSYKTGLESVEERLKSFKINESIYLEDIKCLKFEIQLKEIAIRVLRKKLKIAQKEKDGIQLNVEIFENASKSLNKLIECQIVDNYKKGLGYENYNAVPPPYTGNFMPSTHDLSFTDLDEFANKPVAENYNEEVNVSQPKIEKKTVRPSIVKKEFVKSKQQEKTARKVVKQVEHHRQIQVSDGLGSQKKLIFLPNVQGNLKIDLQDQGVIDSGYSRHMTGNMSYLADYEERNRGYVAIRGNPKGGKIKGKYTTSGEAGMKSRRTVTLTAKDMQKKKNDVKARTNLLLSLPDEQQLRFSKYKTTRELWAAILKTFGGNEATKKTKKNLLKQQYGNFKVEGLETLEQMFTRLQVIVSQLQFMDVEIKQDDLNQKAEFLEHGLISLAKHSSRNEDGNTAYVPTASTNVPTASASVATISQDTACAYIASQSSSSQIKFEDINQIDEDDMKEMDIKWNMALLSMRADKFWKKTRKKISIQGSDVAGSDKSKAPKALMAIDGVGWDWSYMENDEEDHALVADEVAPTEFALMANTSAESKKLETLKEEKERVDGKLAGLLKASKDLDNLIESQRTGLSECTDDTVTDYSRPSPTIERDDQNRNPSVSKTVASPITPKPFIKFVKPKDSQSKKCIVFERHFKLLDDANILLRTPRQHNMYSIDLNNIIPHRDLSCLVAKASTDECILWHKRCDNGGEFRNKEMNDFCSQKGIKREFSNARTLQQNDIAKRRNRTLIEAARTMLADAKLPVSFWAEVVKTACYVQNRVLVNKSHNKTPYELFNGRSPALGFLKPFGYHVMILNTLDNLGKFEEKGDEGTISTNLLGTKDAASQEVKKNVSSLRYIALPNWAHDALLDYSLSKPQDHCSIEVLEGNGNPNPTASTSNPPADQMETLTVKTPIPTVKTPSLDNILSLINWFEDILGVSSNSKESTGVEADISNMETAITASPTLTLRIHKDHPKSQIISPMDTPIQTRNKSKKVGEQSFIATIHQKTDPALLQFYLFSCFLSQVEPNKIFDALQDPSWVEAMQEELLQFKIQNVWTLVNCPKGVRPIGTKWVLKNKKDERWIVIKNKARIVAQGHTQEEGIDYDEVFAPVERIKAIKLFLAYASLMGFTDPESPAKVYKVEKAMYGLHQAPRAWYGTLSKYLLKNGFQMGTIDQTLFIRRKRGDSILVQVYMDDIIFGSSNLPLCREFEALMHKKFQMSAMGELNFFLGLQVLQKED